MLGFVSTYLHATVMKFLLLLRHADAERGGPDISDHARPLSPEGLREAANAGAWLGTERLLPDAVLCSTAVRARQTLDALGLPTSLRNTAIFSDPLYLASPSEILHCVQGLDPTCERALLIGHNPGIRDFCTMFAQAGSSAAQESMALGFKTAGVAGVQFDTAQWADVPGTQGGALEFYRTA